MAHSKKKDPRKIEIDPKWIYWILFLFCATSFYLGVLVGRGMVA